MWVSRKKLEELKKRIANLEHLFERLGSERPKLEYGFVQSEPWVNKNEQRRQCTLAVMITPGEVHYVVVALDNVEIPDSVFGNMERVPKFDRVNEYCRARYLLEHLRKTNQKIPIISTPCGKYDTVVERVKSSQWKDVFLP